MLVATKNVVCPPVRSVSVITIHRSLDHRAMFVHRESMAPDENDH